MAINVSNFKKLIQAKVYAPHFDIIRSQYGQNSFKLLDVGCGPHSVKLFKSIFPKIEYYGIDFNQYFNNVEQVKKFELLPEEWTIDTGELTPTLKLKRRVIMEKFKLQFTWR